MKEVYYVTGNPHKAEYFAKIMKRNIPRVDVDVDEIQSLDVRQVVEHKAKQAYAIVKKPIIIEDTTLSFVALGALPGPLIKWFLEELGPDGLCKLLDGYDDRSAVAGAVTAYYDGVVLQLFERELAGTIATTPKGMDGFGWNKIFIPDGASITLGEMDEETFKTYYHKIKPFDELKKFLDNR